MIRKVIVLYNLPTSDLEADTDTEKSANFVSEGLKKYFSDVQILGIRPNDIANLNDLIVGDFIFNLIEWSGLDYHYAVETIKTLQNLGLPYSGSDAVGFALSADKILMKKRMQEKNISTPKWQVVKNEKENLREDFVYPLICKPVWEHCGMGISQASIVRKEKELRIKIHELWKKYNQPVLVEEFIDGRELHVTVLEKDGRPWVLPPAEVVFAKPGMVLSYDMKWVEKSRDYSLGRIQQAQLDMDVLREVNMVSQRAYTQLGGRDYPRLDIRLRDDEIFVLEINNNPGIDYDLDSGIGISARAVNLGWEELLRHIVINAALRWRITV